MPPITKQDVPTPSGNLSSSKSNGDTGEDQYIADYAELRKRQVAWLYDAERRMPNGDADKCARAIVNVVSGKEDAEGGNDRGWPALGMLVLGADAEMNIRDKCDAVLKNLDEWKEVVRGVSIDPS